MKTTRREFLKSVGTVAAGATAGAAVGSAFIQPHLATAAPSGSGLSEKPLNVLFITCDQHNAHAVGCYGGGFGPTPEMETPNLDRLASEGVMFSNSYCAQGQCCPSRYSLITGLWPHTHGLRWNQIWEPRGETTLPMLARDSGYKTATIGKHHFYWLWGGFEDLGFDLVIENSQYNAHCSANGQSSYTQSAYRIEPMPKSLNYTGWTHNKNEFHSVGYWTDQTIQYLRDRAADDEPFVCYYSFFLPHTPVLPTGPPGDPGTPMPPGEIDWAHKYDPNNLTLPPNLGKVATTNRLRGQQNNYNGVGANSNGVNLTDAQWREILAYYYGLTSQIDWNIGRVLDELDALGLAENTLVVYTADHGEMASEMSCWTKGGGMMDALNRVPLIMRLPGVIPPGKVTDEFAAGVDLVPTIAELTGIPMSDAVRDRIDGRSLVDLMIQDEVPDDWPEEVFSEFCHPAIGAGLAKMIRTKTAKYVWDQNRSSPQEEFYDMVADPYEIDNLINDGSRQTEIQDLRDRLDAWWNNAEGHAPLYLTAVNTSPNINAKPKPPTDPSPRGGTLGVARDIDLQWLQNTASETQDISFGTGNPPPVVKTVDGMVNTFNPGTLDPSVTYYWSVAGSNRNGPCSRPSVWSFTTEAGVGGEPDLPDSPSPDHLAGDVGLSSTLAWSAGAGAVSHRIHFGTENPPPFQTEGPTPNFDPGPLQAGITYYWRVDEVNAAGVTEGDVWSFETDPAGLPGRASAPTPSHFGTDQSRAVRLGWTPGPGATSHNVYFGDTFPLASQGNRAAASFNPGPLELGKTYFWRVDEVNDSGVIPGFTWRFTVVLDRPSAATHWKAY